LLIRKLVEGYDHQVGAYESAERSHYAFYIAIVIGDHERKISRLAEKHNQSIRDGCPTKELILIDARPRASASNR